MTGGFIPSLNSGVLYLLISLFQARHNDMWIYSFTQFRCLYLLTSLFHQNIMTGGFIPSLNSGVLYLLISLFQI